MSMRAETHRLNRTGYRAFWVKATALGLLGLLLLSACGGSSSDSNPTATTASQPSSTAQIAASPAPTEQPATVAPSAELSVLAAATPMATEPPASVTNTAVPANTQQTTSGLPPGVYLATPVDEGLVEKEVTAEPGGPVPTPRQSDFDLDKDGFYTYDELQTAVNTVYPTYHWPVNYRISVETILHRLNPTASTHFKWEAGTEQTVIGLPHLCAWELTLRDAMYAGDTELVAQSIDQIRAVSLPNPAFIYIREYIESAVDKAELGDPAELQGEIDANHCNSIPWEEATPASAGSQQIPPAVAQLVGTADLPRRWDENLA